MMVKIPRFITGNVRVLQLSDGATLIVKKRLSQGDRRAHLARLYVANAAGQMRMNPAMVGLSTVLAYLVDWTVTDDEGAPVHIKGLPSEEVIMLLDNLDQDYYLEVQRAIETHEAEMDRERVEQKKAMAGEPKSAAISSSPSDAVGVSSGSAT